MSAASATEIETCRVLASVEWAVEVERLETHWSLTFEVQVLEIYGSENTAGTWCMKVSEARETEAGTILVTTGQGTDEPIIYDEHAQWYEWSFLDAGELRGERFAPEKR